MGFTVQSISHERRRDTKGSTYLYGCEGFATVTLLDTNVNQAVLHALIIASDGVRKRIECLEVLDARHANSVNDVCLRNENALTTAVEMLELTDL